MGRNGKKSVKARVGKILQAMGRAEGDGGTKTRTESIGTQPTPSGVPTRTVRNFVRDARVTCSTLIFHPRHYNCNYLQC